MKSLLKKIIICGMLIAVVTMLAGVFTVSAENTTDEPATSQTQVQSEEETSESSVSGKALAAGIAIGLAALGGAIGMGMAISKSSEGISRQPEAEGKIRSSMMLGLVFIETAIIYALVVAILIIFVL